MSGYCRCWPISGVFLTEHEGVLSLWVTLMTACYTHSKQYLGKDYGAKKSNVGEVTPQDVPQLAKESFPLCMRKLQETLEETHHLRHGGRMQYGLFLKGIGLSLEDALMFWRTEFGKAMSADKVVPSRSLGRADVSPDLLPGSQIHPCVSLDASFRRAMPTTFDIITARRVNAQTTPPTVV